LDAGGWVLIGPPALGRAARIPKHRNASGSCGNGTYLARETDGKYHSSDRFEKHEYRHCRIWDKSWDVYELALI
jgi:hypothetical protein